MVVRAVATGFVAFVSFGFLCAAAQRPWELPISGSSDSVRTAKPGYQKRFPLSMPVGSGRPAQASRPVYFRKPLQPSMPLESPSPVHTPLHFKPREPVQKPVQSFGSRKPMPGPVLSPAVTAEPEVTVKFELQQPVVANSVAVKCGEAGVQVQVLQDFLGNGQFIQPADLSLGSCPAVGFDDLARVLVFESELQGCGGMLTMTEDDLVYTFTLVYTSSAIAGTPIVRTNDAMVPIECIYPRKHNVSSNFLNPTWMPYASTKLAEDNLEFSLRLMTDDWKFERPSRVYYLGAVLNIEASVLQYHHVPLRVFVERCVAALVMDLDAEPSYSFIDNQGCLMDAQMTGSSSAFLPRVHDDKLQFQLEAFRFNQVEKLDRSSMYITCHLRATTTSASTDAMNKACSFVPATNSWTAADDNDQACVCCDSGCGMRKGRSVDTKGSADVTIGPIIVLEGPLAQRGVLPQALKSQQFKGDADSSLEFVVLSGVIVGVGLVCIIVLGTILYWGRSKPVASCNQS